MTILIDSTKAAALAAAGTSNNPLIFWENDALSATYSTSTGTEVESAVNAQTGTTYDAWICTPGGSGNATLKITFSSAVTLNAMAIAAHNIADIGGLIEFQYFDTSWQDIDSVTPADNQSVMAYFDDITATEWRIRVRSITEDAEIGVAFAGTVMTLPRRIYQGFASPITPNNVVLQSNVSQGGNLLGNLVARRGSSLDAQLTNIDPAFIRGTDFKGFLKHHNDGNGFFWAWRPTKYGDLFYAWREGETINPINSGPRDLMSFNMGLRCYDDA
jgi:hypothetical protein